jgi:RNA polymerase sigma-70 factor (ECF subfamily)
LETRIKALCRKALGTLFDVLKRRERDIILKPRAFFRAGLKEISVTSGRLAVITSRKQFLQDRACLANQVTDEGLLASAAGGDTTAFQILYERYRDPIFRFAYRLLGSAEAAEDVAHDCFLSLIKEPSRFDSNRASLRTYIYATARNLAAKRYHSFGRETAIDELADEPAMAERHAPVARLLDQELALEVQQAIASLPPLQREALVLFEYDELSLAEIGEVVGADANAVKQRLFRAREKLRVRLERYFRIGREAATLRRA